MTQHFSERVNLVRAGGGIRDVRKQVCYNQGACPDFEISCLDLLDNSLISELMKDRVAVEQENSLSNNLIIIDGFRHLWA